MTAVLERPYTILDHVPYSLVFATISGSHLYGFSSSDSDYDVRGMHVASTTAVSGMREPLETYEAKYALDGYEDEVVTHEAKKYFKLLLKNNGYVLEQIFSPLVIVDSGHLSELRAIARTCITSNHSLHYKGFGYGEWRKFLANPTKHVKRILYVFRVLMTGIHLMRTGEVESNILRLNEEFRLQYIPELVAQKIKGYEKSELAAGRGMEFYEREYLRLEEMLISAAANSSLPLEPQGHRELNDLLIRMRKEVECGSL